MHSDISNGLVYIQLGNEITQSRKVAATRSCKVAATKSRKVAATKSHKVAATKSSKTNLHTKNSQAATMPQLAAATKPHHCCLFAAIHCEKPFIPIRGVIKMLWCINVAKTKISASLFCTYAKSRFSHDEASISIF